MQVRFELRHYGVRTTQRRSLTVRQTLRDVAELGNGEHGLDSHQRLIRSLAERCFLRKATVLARGQAPASPHLHFRPHLGEGGGNGRHDLGLARRCQRGGLSWLRDSRRSDLRLRSAQPSLQRRLLRRRRRRVRKRHLKRRQRLLQLLGRHRRGHGHGRRLRLRSAQPSLQRRLLRRRRRRVRKRHLKRRQRLLQLLGRHRRGHGHGRRLRRRSAQLGLHGGLIRRRRRRRVRQCRLELRHGCE